MKILVFGHIPNVYGGRQSSGASFVIYHLSKALSAINGVDCSICATDVFKNCICDGNLKLFGWTKTNFLNFIFSNLLFSIVCFGRCIFFSYKYNQKLLGLFFKSLHLQRCINLNTPDIIQFHNTDSLIYIKLIKKRNAKILLTIHSLNGFNKDVKDYQIWRYLEREETLYPLDYMIFVSGSLMKEWIKFYGYPKAKITSSILNAYDSNVFYYKWHKHFSPEKINIVTIGSISTLKGQRRVLEALSRLQNKSAFYYTCVGNSLKESVDSLEQIATKNNINFKYLGTQYPSAIAELLRGSDYMILPSSYEGFGLVYLESIACGTPVILPKFLPIASEENLLNQDNSILLKDCTVDAIFECLSKLSEYKFISNKMSIHISNYNWNNVAVKYYNLLNEKNI